MKTKTKPTSTPVILKESSTEGSRRSYAASLRFARFFTRVQNDHLRGLSSNPSVIPFRHPERSIAESNGSLANASLKQVQRFLHHAIATLGMTMVIFFTTLLTPTPAHTQGFNLSISPPLLQATIKPGKSISQVFTIYNNGSNPIKLTPSIVPFLPEDHQGNPSLKPQFNPTWLSYFSLANSKIFLNQPFTLLAGQSDQLILNIKVPNLDTPTDHYATLLVSQDTSSGVTGTGSPEVGSGNSTSPISGSIGSNILLTIANQAAPPTILKLAQLEPTNTKFIKIGQTYFLDNLTPVQFKAKLENLGPHQAQAHGLLQVHQGTKVISIQPLLPVNVLAQSTRELTASPSAQSHLGSVADPHSRGVIVFHPKITHIGSFKASLNIRSESGSTQNSINLVLLPVKALLGLILGLILLNWVLTSSNKKFIVKS